MNKFYTVTVFEGDESVGLYETLSKTLKRKYSAYDSKRTMGIFQKRIDATNMVRYNRSDIHECLYGYCIIEEFKFGCIYGNISKPLSLWKWVSTKNPHLQTDYWKQINVPPMWAQSPHWSDISIKDVFTNFAIG